MKRPIVKVCGITREQDGDCALQLGADYLGFIVYQKSPRAISLERAGELLTYFKTTKRVCVDVAPSEEKLRAIAIMDFDAYQFHFNMDTGEELIAEWSRLVGGKGLWLAPRIPGGEPFPEWVLKYADTVLLDTYHPGAFGGSGQTGDWSEFYSISQKYPNTQFILAGGLSPGNMEKALAQTQANWVDVNSCVESAPGIKDAHKMRKLFNLGEA